MRRLLAWWRRLELEEVLEIPPPPDREELAQALETALLVHDGDLPEERLEGARITLIRHVAA